MSVTAEQLEILKQQIKSELLNEMQPKSTKANYWLMVKQLIDKRLLQISINNPMSRYQIQSALSVIIRHSLKLSRVSAIKPHQVEEAKAIVNKTFDIMSNVQNGIPLI